MMVLRLICCSICFGSISASVYSQTADIIRENGGPEEDFTNGIAARHNASKSRAKFQKAASWFDREWLDDRCRTRTLALNRGRAHFLAGDLPRAIRAFRDGLDQFPWDAEIQRDLAIARAAVAYPTETEPSERVRPDPPDSLRNRVSPWDLFAIATISSLLTAVGLARRLTSADGWSLPVAVLGLVGLVATCSLAVLIERERARDRDQPIVVLCEDTHLRTGNGPTFSPRIDSPLPRGAEVRLLGRRGGWAQVELPGGAVGWVPESVVLGVDVPVIPRM